MEPPVSFLYNYIPVTMMILCGCVEGEHKYCGAYFKLLYLSVRELSLCKCLLRSLGACLRVVWLYTLSTWPFYISHR